MSSITREIIDKFYEEQREKQRLEDYVKQQQEQGTSDSASESICDTVQNTQ